MKDDRCIMYKPLWKAYVHATIYISLKSVIICYYTVFLGFLWDVFVSMY